MRTNRLELRLGNEELKIIQERAASSKMMVARFVRTAVLSGIPPVIPAVNIEVLHHLQKIGTNINQLAHRANTSGRIELDELNGLRHEIARLRLSLVGAIK